MRNCCYAFRRDLQGSGQIDVIGKTPSHRGKRGFNYMVNCMPCPIQLAGVELDLDY
jgi:hypothetical protein